MSSMEWIPTSKPQDRTESQASRRRPFPFRSYRAGTIGVILRFAHQYAMFVSVEALLSVVNSGVGHVHWDGWGPTCTRILPLGPDILPRPAGPFWITCYEPLVVRDYNSLRARYIKSQEPSTHPYPPLGPSTTKMFGKHWAGGSIKTHLPFREFAARNLIFQSVLQVVADREWVVVISRTVRYSILLRPRVRPIMCTDRAQGRELLLPCTMWVRPRQWRVPCGEMRVQGHACTTLRSQDWFCRSSHIERPLGQCVVCLHWSCVSYLFQFMLSRPRCMYIVFW